ncbi:MAG: PEP-CTERM sorting domain-containing protein, partial [Aeoliella sp.]
ARNSANGRGWDGLLDEIAIWDTSLSAGAVASIYNHGLAGNTIPEPSLGDANGDTMIDELDFFLISDNLSSSVGLGTLGDVDIDGQVTFNDFRIWKDNATAAGLAAAGFGPVPEPATVVLLGGALALFGFQRSRRR